jgi:hypothetical protein
VIVTHEPDVAHHCNRIVRMRDGRIELDDRVAEGPAGVGHSPASQKVDLLRALAAQGDQLGEALSTLGVADRAELSRLFASWAERLRMPSNGEQTSHELARET